MIIINAPSATHITSILAFFFRYGPMQKTDTKDYTCIYTFKVCKLQSYTDSRIHYQIYTLVM